MNKDIKLGCEAIDIITGAQGIIVQKVEYLNGLIEYGIQQPHDDLIYQNELFIKLTGEDYNSLYKSKPGLGFNVKEG